MFLPSQGGLHSIVSEAVGIGLKDPSLAVIGAISDSQAMWGATSARTMASGKKVPAWSPYIFSSGGVSVVRATALTDKSIGRQLGDFQLDETLAAEKAIIHDKILVVDPMDPVGCVVAFGSHNLGYKASYSNDENLTIVQGHRELAQAYATHVLDVYDHYRYRAAEAENSVSPVTGAGASKRTPWDGFLDKTPRWQAKASHRLANYFTA